MAQSVTCLATDASLTANPGVASSNPVRSHTFVEIDHEIISTVIFLSSAESSSSSRRVVVSYKRKYVHEVLVNRMFNLAQEKVWKCELTVPPWLGRKATKQTKQNDHVHEPVHISQWPWLISKVLYVPVNNFSSWRDVFMGSSSTKQRMKCLAQGRNTVPPLSLKLATLQPQNGSALSKYSAQPRL